MSSFAPPTRKRWLALALGLLSYASATVASAQPLADGVVLDSARGIAYLASAEGHVRAVDLASGAPLWSSSAAAKPIALVGDKLLAQTTARGLTLAVLDGRAGTVERTFQVKLPAGVEARVTDTPRRVFRLQAEPLTQQQLLVRWSHLELARPLRYPVELGTAVATRATTGARSQTGAFQLDIGGGRIVEVPPAQTTRAASAEAIAEAAAYLVDGPRRLPSADGRHSVTSERLGGSETRRYRWTVLDAAGAVAGGVETTLSAAPFVVRGNTLFVVVSAGAERVNGEIRPRPYQLKALDLTTGVERWAHELVDARYRGPLPK